MLESNEREKEKNSCCVELINGNTLLSLQHRVLQASILDLRVNRCSYVNLAKNGCINSFGKEADRLRIGFDFVSYLWM